MLLELHATTNIMKFCTYHYIYMHHHFRTVYEAHAFSHFFLKIKFLQ
jgi:hypothetical protein